MSFDLKDNYFMKRIITCLAIVVAVAGVVVAKANESKFASQASAVFYTNGSSTTSLLSSNPAPQLTVDEISAQQAQITDVSGNPHDLWQDVNRSKEVYFQP